MPDATTPAQPSILIVDDDDIFRERLVRAFDDRGFEAIGAADHTEALRRARHESPEFAVLDLRMPGPSGLELLRDLLDVDPATRVVILTGYGSIATTVEAMRLGAVNYVPKPAGVDDILAAFDRSEKPPLDPADIEFTAPSLERTEWEHINRVLADCGGNISETARRLGIHRRTLQRKLDRYPPRD